MHRQGRDNSCKENIYVKIKDEFGVIKHVEALRKKNY